MEKADAQNIVAHCCGLWRFMDKWPPERLAALIEGLTAIDTTPTQAKAALNELCRTVEKPPTMALILSAVRRTVRRLVAEKHRWHRHPPDFRFAEYADWCEYIEAIAAGDITGGPVDNRIIAYAVGMLRETGETPTWAQCCADVPHTDYPPNPKHKQTAAQAKAWGAIEARLRNCAGRVVAAIAARFDGRPPPELNEGERRESLTRKAQPRDDEFEAEIDREIGPNAPYTGAHTP